MPRWGRGVLCLLSLLQNDTLNYLRQYDTMNFFCLQMIFFYLSTYITKVKNEPYIYTLIFQFVFIILIFQALATPVKWFDLLIFC